MANEAVSTFPELRPGTEPPELGGSAEHLRILSICHYVVAAVLAAFSLLPLIHVAIGMFMVSGGFGDMLPTAKHPGAGFPDGIGWFFIAIGGTCIALGLTKATCIAFAGHFLATRRRWTYCIIVAGLACISFPIGTVLGVFTIVTLTRPEVKAAFRAA